MAAPTDEECSAGKVPTIMIVMDWLPAMSIHFSASVAPAFWRRLISLAGLPLIVSSCAELGLRCERLDGSLDLDASLALVEDHFRDHLPTTPNV